MVLTVKRWTCATTTDYHTRVVVVIVSLTLCIFTTISATILESKTHIHRQIPQYVRFSFPEATKALPSSSSKTNHALSAGFCAGGTSLALNGAATRHGSELLLSALLDVEEHSSAYFHQPVAVISGFRTSFTFRVARSSNRVGGDGFAFIVQGDSLEAIGDRASSIGYGGEHGIRDAVVLEFDTYQNTEYHDPSAHHVSLHFPAHPGERLSADEVDRKLIHDTKLEFTDGREYLASIAYSSTGTWQVELSARDASGDTESFVLQDRPLQQRIELFEDSGAYVGFTAASGGKSETHSILSWAFSPTPHTSGSLTRNLKCADGFGPPHCEPVVLEPYVLETVCREYVSCADCITSKHCCIWDTDDGHCTAAAHASSPASTIDQCADAVTPDWLKLSIRLRSMLTVPSVMVVLILASFLFSVVSYFCIDPSSQIEHIPSTRTWSDSQVLTMPGKSRSDDDGDDDDNADDDETSALIL
jgi:Legume lectin domain